MEYNFKEIEKKWRQAWAEQGTYRVKEDAEKEKFYVLNMFPYPSEPVCMWVIRSDTSLPTFMLATSVFADITY